MSLKTEIAELKKQISFMQKEIKAVKGSANEAVFAEIFNNVISNSQWLKNTSFSAGRWAVGYPFLYAMYRILNEIKPQKILELGLGQSTRMIGQYATFNEKVRHFVVEDNPDWVEFFKKDFYLSERTEIVQLDTTYEKYKEAEKVRVYKGFLDKFKEEKFDFISVDAPIAGDMKFYGRIDVLKILPNCLSDNFIIMIDDTERVAETNTIKEIIEILKQNNIAYKIGRYSGNKDCTIITCKKLKWLCSM